MSTRETTRALSVWVTGEPVPAARRRRGSFTDMIQATVGDAWGGPWQELDCVDEPCAFPAPAQVAGVIVTGSPARIADQSPWMLALQARLRSFVVQQVPIFGICFGHQLLGAALGGRSGPNPRGREIGTVPMTLQAADPLFGAEPRSFAVAMTHLDSVLELPAGAVSLGSTDLERHAAVRFATNTWGVQFHPELDAEVVGDYVASRREALLGEGLDPDALLRARAETPESADLLRRFARYVHQWGR